MILNRLIHPRSYRRVLFDYMGLTFVLIGLILFFGFMSEHFLSVSTFQTIANQIPDAIVIATGMTFVLILGGIDLSVGSVLALSSAVLGMSLTQWGLPLALALPIGMCVGLGCGLCCGLFVIAWRLPAFIVTLGMMEAARGGAYLVTHSRTQYIGSSIERLTEISFQGLSLPFFLALAIVAAGQIILSGTVLGRHMFATGANEESARLSGIHINGIKVVVYSISGLLSGLAAALYCSRLSAADPNAGTGYELQAIAAVVIGGTSLMGGRGSVINSFFGVLIIAVLQNGLVQIGAEEPVKRLVTGAVIIAAVVADYYRNRLRGVKA